MSGFPGGYPPPYPQYPGHPQYPAPGPYPPPYPGYPHSPRNGMGIAALVVAIVGLVAGVTVVGGVVLGVVAIILGIIGRRRAVRGEANNGGVAIAGVALGALAIVIALVFIPIWVGFFTEIGGSDYMDCLAKAGADPTARDACTQQLGNRLNDQLGVTTVPSR